MGVVKANVDGDTMVEPSRPVSPASVTVYDDEAFTGSSGVKIRVRLDAHRYCPGMVGDMVMNCDGSRCWAKPVRSTTGRSNTQRNSTACSMPRNLPLGDANTTLR